MKCDICGEELANSEALKAHKEREHAPDDTNDEELEAPDLMEEGQEQPELVV